MIKLSHVMKQYDVSGETFLALKNVSLEIKNGEYTAIVGPSGSGKSTLMHIMGLLDLPSSGSVMIDGRDVSHCSDTELSRIRNESVGFVFQQFNLINKLTVLENILLPAVYCRASLPYDPKVRALDMIRQFGIAGKEKSYPNRISGGQQQRVAIARALIMNPKMILADEPTGNIDSKTGLAILSLLESLNRDNGVTVVLITHDKEVAKRARRHIHIYDGEISAK